MKLLRKVFLALLLAPVALILALNLWGMLTLGTLDPAPDAARDPDANKVVMVFGATGSVGDGLLKAAMLAPEVEKVYAVTRRMSPRLEEGAASGRVEVIMHEDFTDYSMLGEELAEVNTVLWGLGTTSVGADPDTYRWIHVDFPLAFVEAWLQARTEGPMAFHNVTGMGTGEEQDAPVGEGQGLCRAQGRRDGTGQWPARLRAPLRLGETYQRERQRAGLSWGMAGDPRAPCDPRRRPGAGNVRDQRES